MSRKGGPEGECRSCGAPIYWAQSKNKKWIPVDREPVHEQRSKFTLMKRPDGRLRFLHIHDVLDNTEGRPPPGLRFFVAHFKTCPNAKDHRRSS